MIPVFDGAVFSRMRKGSLWVEFSMASPVPGVFCPTPRNGSFQSQKAGRKAGRTKPESGTGTARKRDEARKRRQKAGRKAGRVRLLAIGRDGKRDGKRKAGRVRYWQYGQAEKSPDLAISDLSRFPACPASRLSGPVPLPLTVPLPQTVPLPNICPASQCVPLPNILLGTIS